MRHVIVTRVSVLLTAWFMAAAGVFAWLTRGVDPARNGARPSSSGGAALFEEHCAACHTLADLRSSTQGITGSRRLELERFLLDHGNATSEADRQILDELSRDIPRSPR